MRFILDFYGFSLARAVAVALFTFEDFRQITVIRSEHVKQGVIGSSLRKGQQVDDAVKRRHVERRWMVSAKNDASCAPNQTTLAHDVFEYFPKLVGDVSGIAVVEMLDKFGQRVKIPLCQMCHHQLADERELAWARAASERALFEFPCELLESCCPIDPHYFLVSTVFEMQAIAEPQPADPCGKLAHLLVPLQVLVALGDRLKQKPLAGGSLYANLREGLELLSEDELCDCELSRAAERCLFLFSTHDSDKKDGSVGSVYMIHDRGTAAYVGSTSLPLELRLLRHAFDMPSKRAGSLFQNYARAVAGGLQNMEISLLVPWHDSAALGEHQGASLVDVETHWIQKIARSRFSLNTQHGGEGLAFRRKEIAARFRQWQENERQDSSSVLVELSLPILESDTLSSHLPVDISSMLAAPLSPSVTQLHVDASRTGCGGYGWNLSTAPEKTAQMMTGHRHPLTHRIHQCRSYENAKNVILCANCRLPLEKESWSCLVCVNYSVCAACFLLSWIPDKE